MRPYKKIINQKFVIVIFQYLDKSIGNDRKIRYATLKKNRPTIFSHFWETKFYCDFSAKIVGECIGTIRKKCYWEFLVQEYIISQQTFLVGALGNNLKLIEIFFF